MWSPNKERELNLVYGGDKDHPEWKILQDQVKDVYVGGRVESVELPTYTDYLDIRKTPDQLKKTLDKLGWNRVVAFQTRNPMHNAHIELTKKAAVEYNCKVLLQPVVGPTKVGDIDYQTRMKCYAEIIDE